MKRETTDLLIIGSGFGGAVAARRLHGLGRVILLEKGRLLNILTQRMIPTLPSWGKMIL